MMKRLRLALVVMLFLALACLLFAYLIFWAANEFEGDRIVVVSKGMMFHEVADSLHAAGVIRSKLLFEIAGELRGATRKVRIGKYLFRGPVSNREILEDLVTGRSALLISVRIPEGIRITLQARILRREIGIDSARFVGLAFDPEFVTTLEIPARSLEGFLMPDTYMFYWQEDEEEIIKRMAEQFKLFYVDSLEVRGRELRLSLTQVVTLASIIEGETMLDNERAIISGVYHNRLKKQMRLEADPTIQYVLADGPRRLRYSDLKIASPYNTYLNYGLPPGSINNPGRASILAALFPMKHDYVFFVANGSGGHTFSRTYAQHQRAVAEFRKIREQTAKMESDSVEQKKN